MKIIINLTNITNGGVVQVALSFLEEIKSIKTNRYFIFITRNVSQQIILNSFPNNIHFYHFRNSPKSLSIFKILNSLRRLENEIAPDCVFSLFGPTYWTPRANHLMGFALPHYIYPEYFYRINYTFSEKTAFIFKKHIHRLFIRWNANYYVTETTSASERLSSYIKVDKTHIFTVSNTYSNLFDKPIRNLNLVPSNNGQFRLITISTYYKHKNLEIINKIIPLLKLTNVKFLFILTISNDIYNKLFSENKEYVQNLGPIPVKNCPYVYSMSDALFMPTLLECFSASYPEAMKMRIPILTSNLSFAHDICDDAACYFDPFNPQDIFEKIITVISNPQLRNQLVQNGIERLKSFETAKSRAEKYLSICEKIAKNKSPN